MATSSLGQKHTPVAYVCQIQIDRMKINSASEEQKKIQLCGMIWLPIVLADRQSYITLPSSDQIGSPDWIADRGPARKRENQTK
jgi:hypothetical protein